MSEIDKKLYRKEKRSLVKVVGRRRIATVVPRSNNILVFYRKTIPSVGGLDPSRQLDVPGHPM